MIFATLWRHAESHGTFLVVDLDEHSLLWLHWCCSGFCNANHKPDYFDWLTKCHHRSFEWCENLAEIAKNPFALMFLNYLCCMHLLHMCIDDDATMLSDSFERLAIRLCLRMMSSNHRFSTKLFYLWNDVNMSNIDFYMFFFSFTCYLMLWLVLFWFFLCTGAPVSIVDGRIFE